VQVFGTLASIESDGVLLTLTGLVMLPTVFIDGPEGVRYRIDYKDSLEDPAWMPLTNVVLPARRLYHVDFTATNSPRRFYLTTPTP